MATGDPRDSYSEIKKYKIFLIEGIWNAVESADGHFCKPTDVQQLLSERDAEIAKLKINCSGFELESIRLGKKVAEQGADLTKLREVNETQWEHCEELKGKLQQQDSIIYDLRELIEEKNNIIKTYIECQHDAAKSLSKE